MLPLAMALHDAGDDITVAVAPGHPTISRLRVGVIRA
jgi:hypothetical protein